MATENIYQICIGDNKIEFYSLASPVIDGERLICKQLIRKSYVTEDVMGVKIEVFYKAEFKPESKKEDTTPFLISDGIQIKLFILSDLEWWGLTEKEAKDLLKEKVLQHYQKTVPALIQNVNQLTKQLQMIQSHPYQEEGLGHNQPKRKNDFLIP